jgi:hypothetical protein
MCCVVCIPKLNELEPNKGTAYTYHCDSIIEQGLSKDNNVEDLIDVDFLKDREHGDRVHG